MKQKILLVSETQDLWPVVQLKALAEKYEIIFADINTDILNELTKAEIADKGLIKIVILTKAYIFGHGPRHYADVINLAKSFFKELFIIGMVEKDKAMNYTPHVSDVIYIGENNWDEVEEMLDSHFKI